MEKYKCAQDVVFNSFENGKIAKISKKDIETYSNYKEIVEGILDEYIKDADRKTMMIKLLKMEKGSQTRATHQAKARQIIQEISNGLDLEPTIGTTAMSYHDISHAFLGHASEKIINNFFKKIGYGNMVHNAQAIRKLLYKERIIDRIKEKMDYQSATSAEKKSVEKVIWGVCDIILCHNGETNKYNFTPKKIKTRKELIFDTLSCFAIEGYDRDRIAATDIGCLAKIVDVISYLGQDIVDGLNNGFIKPNEVKEKYTENLEKIGITEDEIDACLSNKKSYSILARLIENNLCKIIIKENKGKKGIHISNDVIQTIGKIKNTTFANIAQRTMTKEMEVIYTDTVEFICEMGKEILQKEKVIDDLIITHGCTKNKDINKLEEAEAITQEQKEKVIEHRDSLIKKYKGTYFENFIKSAYDSNFRDFYFTVVMTKNNMEQTQNVDHKKIVNLLDGICYNISANYIYSLNDDEMFELIKKINNERKKYPEDIIDELNKPYNGKFGEGDGARELALQIRELDSK